MTFLLSAGVITQLTFRRMCNINAYGEWMQLQFNVGIKQYILVTCWIALIFYLFLWFVGISHSLFTPFIPLCIVFNWFLLHVISSNSFLQNKILVFSLLLCPLHNLKEWGAFRFPLIRSIFFITEGCNAIDIILRLDLQRMQLLFYKISSYCWISFISFV